MATCTKCGAELSAGNAFCTRCGARVESTPSTPAPESPKKRTWLIVALVAAALVVGVGLGLVFSGAFGHSSPAAEEASVLQTPAGTWSLVSSSRGNYDPGEITLMLDENRGGYCLFPAHAGGTVDGDYHVTYNRVPLIWTDSTILFIGELCSYSLSGDTLTLKVEDISFLFTRSGEVEERTALKPGQYTLTHAERGGKDVTDRWAGAGIQIYGDRIASLYETEDTYVSTWDEYFFFAYSECSRAQYFFYTFDGNTLTLVSESLSLTFSFFG